MAVPVVRPRKVPKYTCEQSHYDSVPQIPFRMLVLGPSNSGKSQLIQALLCDFLKSHKNGSSCFHKIVVISPSVNVDAVWGPVKELQKSARDPREKVNFEVYDPAALHDLIAQQKKLVAACKKRGDEEMPSMCVVLDDIADDVHFCRHERLVQELFVRGRHAFISIVASVQKYRVIAPVVRVNCSCLCVFKLRSDAELKALVEENSAAFGGAEALTEAYRLATREKYSFLYLDLVNDQAYVRFERALQIT